MARREISIGEYTLMFDQGRKLIRGIQLMGPCTFEQEIVSLYPHGDSCSGYHMYALSKTDFKKTYTAMKKRGSGVVSKLRRIAMELEEKNQYLAGPDVVGV